MQVKLFTIRMDAEYLEIDQNSLNDFLENIAFKKSDTHFIESESSCWSVLIHYECEFETQSAFKTDEIFLSETDEILFEKLKLWRNEKSQELSLPHYMICHNSELKNVANIKPFDKIQLKKINGFGELKSEKYGSEIISIIQSVK